MTKQTSDQWPRWVLPLAVLLVFFAGMSAAEGLVKNVWETKQDAFNHETIAFEQLAVDPTDPTVTLKQINGLRERLGMKDLPLEQLKAISIRMGISPDKVQTGE